MSSSKEVSHYVVTAHPPGSVLLTAKCNFLSATSPDTLVAKVRRIEVRQLRSTAEISAAFSPFPIVLQLPINGRLTAMIPFSLQPNQPSFVFLLTERLQYAVISYSPSSSPHPVRTHAHGSLMGRDHNILGRAAETGPIVALDHYSRCIALHLYDGLVSILPIISHYQPSKPLKSGEMKPSDRPEHSVLGEPFHCRVEERTILQMVFLQSTADLMPQLCVLHQDARGLQHLTSHVVNLDRHQLHLYGSQSAPANTEWLKKASVDGGSSMLIPVPPRLAPPVASAAASSDSVDSTKKVKSGGVIVVGQRQFTFCNAVASKILPVPQALFLAYEELPVDPNGMPRYLLGDEFGNLHMLTLMAVSDKTVAMQIETLGSCALGRSLSYLGEGLVYVGSALGDSQLVQIHDEPLPVDQEPDADESATELADSTYLTVIEEYTNLGPILDFDLVPTTPGAPIDTSGAQCQVVTASGTSKLGSLRLIRNGIGMNEYANVEIPGIQNMWSLRKSFHDKEDTYLIQSFVGETRVLGVVASEPMEEDEGTEQEVGGSLEEVYLPGLDSMASTLFVGNIEPNDRILQITESEIRLISTDGQILDTWNGPITVASANEAGQIGVALSGGLVKYMLVKKDKLTAVFEKQMGHEVSCLDLHAFACARDTNNMEIDPEKTANHSNIMAVGLWDDYTVRLLSLYSDLDELFCINLGTDEEEEGADSNVANPSRRNRNNMMARSLSLVTLDFSSSNTTSSSSSSPGVDMLFVGLGDGTLISFAVVSKSGSVSVHSKKEVCLGTQRIDLIPLATEKGGTCILATGDRPTVVYLAGVGGSSANQFNPKLCYSNVNLASSEDDDGGDVSKPQSQQSIAVNVASSFFSSLLFDRGSLDHQRYSLCVADDSSLRLGVIDDIQKLHVTTCRLGMAPRRIVYCPEGRMFAVGCIESGINQFGLSGEESNMGNCIRFMDDTTFDDLDRADMEPYEIIMSMAYVTLKVPSLSESGEAAGTSGKDPSVAVRPFLLVGTGYALPDEDEPTHGRILVYSCQGDESNPPGNSRAVRQVTELSTTGCVYSIAQFYDGKVLCSVNTKTEVCKLVQDAGLMKLQFVGTGHHGHILSLCTKTRAKRIPISDEMKISGDDAVQVDLPEVRETKKPVEKPNEKLAIVGDLMRSIGLVKYYDEHEALEEIARDFNSNWTTAVEMLTDNVYLGAENWNNLFCLRRNTASSNEEVRCRLDTIGEFHLGEMCNKFMSGSLVMPVASSSSIGSSRRALRRATSPQKRKGDSPSKLKTSRSRSLGVVTGSQTLLGTVDGSLGVVLGLDGKTAAFFSSLERAMENIILPVGNLSHQIYRACHGERRVHPAHGFIDGDLIESFLDLDRSTMEAVVTEMNRDGGWEVDDVISSRANADEDDGATHPIDDLTLDEVLAMVEEMTMLH